MKKTITKQGLAITAIIVLLELALIMVFTFSSAFTTEKTISGSITFANGLTIAVTDTNVGTAASDAGITIVFGTGEESASVTGIEFDSTAFVADSGVDAEHERFILSADAKAVLTAIHVTITNESTKIFYTNSTITSAIENVEFVNTTLYGPQQIGTVGTYNGENASYTFSDYISDIYVTGTVTAPSTFTILIEASYNEFLEG